MDQILLLVVVYHIFGTAAALLIDNWIRNDTYRTAILLFALALLSGCEMVPVNVTPLPDVAAVRVQNETTKTHIKTFSQGNKKTIKHVEKIKEEVGVTDDKVRSAKKDLEELLKQ